MRHPIHRREFLTRTAASAALLSLSTSAHASPDEPASAKPPRISYFKNGQIHVGEIGQPDGRPLTTGHDDFKPSWSRTGDMLVCFRRTKDDPVTVNWRSFIFVINADGTGFHQLTDGDLTNFNPTWTRDGHNTPVWNRKNDRTGSFFVMQSKAGNQPGREVALTDEAYHTWVFSSLTDGRLLVSCNHPKQGWGYYLMTRKDGGEPTYERIDCDLAATGLLDRVSVSPSEKRVCFEYQNGFTYKDPGRTLYIADFDPQKSAITSPKPIANADKRPYWFAYPRWIAGESTVIYHASAGKGRLFVYRLEDGTTDLVSTDPDADYRYPHGEAAPC